jgi:septum formation inhibitor-activating ATPase MinD
MTRLKSAREEGIKEATIKNAKNFLIMRLDVEVIANGTGLSIEDVQKIKKELN